MRSQREHCISLLIHLNMFHNPFAFGSMEERRCAVKVTHDAITRCIYCICAEKQSMPKDVGAKRVLL